MEYDFTSFHYRSTTNWLIFETECSIQRMMNGELERHLVTMNRTSCFTKNKQTYLAWFASEQPVVISGDTIPADGAVLEVNLWLATELVQLQGRFNSDHLTLRVAPPYDGSTRSCSSPGGGLSNLFSPFHRTICVSSRPSLRVHIAHTLSSIARVLALWQSSLRNVVRFVATTGQGLRRKGEGGTYRIVSPARRPSTRGFPFC